MKNHLLLVSLLSSVLVSSFAAGQQTTQTARSDEPAASPEMSRLAKMFAGDWDTVETMERGEFFPNGGGRHGMSHCGLGAGGTTLICQGHSDGSAGKLSYLIAMWWDKDAQVYHFFTCFNDAKSPCELRGTAHWEGETFVNDFEGTVNGQKTKFRDSFTQTTPNSRALVAAVETANGTMKTMITTKSTRRSTRQ